MNYSQFSTEDFVLDDYFRKWANQQLPAEDYFWENWLEQHPEKEPFVSQAKFVLEALRMKEVSADDRHIGQRIEKIIALTDPRPPARELRFYSTIWFKVAASIVVICGLGWYGFRDEPARQGVISEEMATRMIEKNNDAKSPLLISLLDGSSVTLQPESRLRYPEKFSDEIREVYLEGEALFEVAKNPQKPFLVHANGLTTKVLGTSFSVRSFEEDRDVVVKVFTGKVAVLPTGKVNKSSNVVPGQNNAIILTPNQMVVFSRSSERLTKTLVPQPKLLAPPKPEKKFDHPFDFNNTPVAQVFSILEKSYGVAILYDDELLRQCTVTAPLGDEGLYQKLDLICKVIRADYEIVDAQVVISSKGCN